MNAFFPKHILLTLIIVTLYLPAWSQELNTVVSKSSQSSQSIKLDEFIGFVNDCELQARVEVLFRYLQENPNTLGYIIMYNGADQLPAKREKESTMKRTEWRIIKDAKFGKWDIEKLRFINGGFREKLSTEIWSVPEGALPPAPTQTIPKPTLPVNEAYLYDNSYLFRPYEDIEPYEFLLPAIKAEYDKAEEEFEAELKTKSKQEKEEIEELESLTKKEIEEMRFFWTDRKFGEIIKNQKGSKGTIIFYADDTRLNINKIKRHIEEGKRKIAKETKISSDDIRVVFGGYRDTFQADFWIVPGNGTPPIPTPESRSDVENSN